MRRILTRGASTVALLLACTPTEPCACPPQRTSLVVYGEVRTADGTAAAGAVVRYALAAPPTGVPAPGPCELNPATSDADPAEARADDAGRFRTQVYSVVGPATRCLRVTGHSTPGTGSATIDGLLVPFRYPRPDSVGVVLTLQ